VGIVGSVLPSPTVQAGSADDPRWRLCPPVLHSYLKPRADELYTPGTTEIIADESEMLEDGTSAFRGNVLITRDDIALQAEQVTYESETDYFELSNSAEFWSDSLFWAGEKGAFDGAAEVGRLENGEYLLLERRGRGKAGVITTDNRENVSRLQDLDYSTCPGQKPGWRMSASSIKLNHNNDIGTARNVTVWVKKMPVFYSPFLTFPLSDARKSGFLTPSFGSSNESGFTVSTPYYWNMAPQRDLTVTPQVMANRGVRLKGEFRYLFETGNGQADLEYLPNDSEFDDKSRHLMRLWHRQYFFTYRGRLTVDYNRVSDKNYFEDFGGSLGVASTSFLPQNADFYYVGRRFWAWTRALSFQTVDSSLPGGSRPYKLLPQILFGSLLPAPDNRPNFQLSGQATYFDREDTIVGSRIELRPQFSWPLYSASGFFLPNLSVRHTQYFLDHQAPGMKREPSRTVPVFSVDSGLYLDRESSLFGRPQLQTLEPRLYYLYVPEDHQDTLPIFDTGEYDFSFAQLFRDNRFAGGDRVGDANQISLAVTSRWLDEKSGYEILRGSIGQTFFFKDREVTLPNRAPETDNTSELIGEIFVRMTRDWSLRYALQWDPNDVRTEKSNFVLRYRPDEQTVVNFAYRLNRTSTGIEQTDFSFRWPVNERWSLVGRWNYSIEDNRSLETFGGVEYDSCCWAFKAVARRFLSSADGTFDTGFFLQVELKGLAGLGRGTSTFLKRSVPGYLPDDF
jgi:LPS-assembly protein